MAQHDLHKSLSLPMLVALGAAGILGTSWVYTASDFFAEYGAGGEIFGLAWVIAVASLYRIRRLHPEQPAPYRVRPGWLPGVGGAAALVIIAAILLPGTGLSLVWPQEYLILVAWAALGVVVYALAPRPPAAEVQRALLGSAAQPPMRRNTGS